VQPRIDARGPIVVNVASEVVELPAAPVVQTAPDMDLSWYEAPPQSAMYSPLFSVAVKFNGTPAPIVGRAPVQFHGW